MRFFVGGLKGPPVERDLEVLRFGGFRGFFVAFCLDVRTLTFCQLMGFPLNH